MSMEHRLPFGVMPDGRPVEELILTDGPLSCSILTYGGALRTLTVPDREGRTVDIVLGYDTLKDYLVQDKYLGALIGRYANRIGSSRFSLDGKEYPLPSNDGANHLHGGNLGFDKQVWTVQSLTSSSATLTLTSPDGEEGYPGELKVSVTYTLRNRALEISYRAQSSKTTLCSLTNHAYFNLSGHASGLIDAQWFQLPSSRYTPVDTELIPIGDIVSVEGTAMDLTAPQPLGKREYDHNWVIDGWDGSLRLAARAWSLDTGIRMEVLTTLPGVQFYTGNFLGGSPKGKDGAPYAKHWAVCLETQYFPDSPNHRNFPSAKLAAGEIYESKTVYRFETGEEFL